jgi:hypothetical protein
LKQSDGSAAAGSVIWSSNATNSQNITETAGDKRMMKGYLDTSNTSTTKITVTGLGAPYSTNGYDVYVYVDGDNGTATRAGTYKIGTHSYVCTDGSGKAFSGAYALGSNRTGNFMIYPTVGGTGFTLTAVPGTSSDSTKSAPLNGLQIVAHNLPPVPPDVAITSPADGAGVVGFSEITGTAKANNGAILSRVAVALGHRTASGAYEFWNGNTWITNIYFRLSTLNNSAGTWRMSSLPTGGNLTDGTYLIRAIAIDNYNQTSVVQTYFKLDSVPPVVTINTPSNGATLTSLTQILGNVDETGSGLQRIDMVIKRLSDNMRWNGNTWVNFETGISTVTNGISWNCSQNLPTGADLANGNYELKAVAFDNAGNVGVDTVTITINKAASAASVVHLPTPTTEAKVTISSVVADDRDSTIELTFTGPLNSTTATDKTHFTITVNGKVIPAESALYNRKTATITLVMTDSTLLKGDEVKVTWSGLLDSDGHAVPSNAPAVFVDEE